MQKRKNPRSLTALEPWGKECTETQRANGADHRLHQKRYLTFKRESKTVFNPPTDLSQEPWGHLQLALEKLTALLSENNIDVPIEWNTPKPVRGQDGSQWFVGKHDPESGEYIAHFGDWKRGLEISWSSVDQGEMSGEERAKYKARLAENAERARELREKSWEQACLSVAGNWDAMGDVGTTPYLERKGIKGLYGCRILSNEHGEPILVVPMRDTAGKLWNYQRVYAQKLSKGDKFFCEGARIEGCFHTLPWEGEDADEVRVKDGDTLFICEGIATAASVATAIYPQRLVDGFVWPNPRVLAAFNAGNLEAVARGVRNRCPASRIVLCADNDAFVEFKNKDGTTRKYNVGVEKGRAAAQAVNGELRFPNFKNPDPKLTDWNDLAAVAGADEVFKQILEPTKEEVETQQKLLKDRPKRNKLPPEKMIADILVRELDGRLMRTDKEVFGYNGTHWVEFGDAALDRIKQRINELCDNGLTSRDMGSYLRTLLVYLPTVPQQIDMFAPNPFIANFQNGSLHFIKDKWNKFRIDFRAHDKWDFVTSCLPFDFPGFEKIRTPPPTPMFDDWCRRVFADDNIEDCIKAYEELGGVGILQAFPIIAFFQGQSRSGKSTAIKLIVKMLSRENTSSVQPGDWYGFKMEPMLGKLVNYDLDLNTTRPIQDTVAKKVFDRAQFMVERKGKRNIFAPLPAAHLFACNELPPTNALTKNVYQHRFVILRFGKYVAPEDAGMDFDEMLWSSEGEGIVCRFLAGLMRLTDQGGRFTKPASSREAITEMEVKADSVQQFLKDLREGDVRDKNTLVALDVNARIERPLLWEIFDAWQDGHQPNPGAKIGRTTLFERVATAGFKVITVRGVRFFEGIGSRASGESIG